MKLIEAYLKNTAQRARRARLFRRAGALLSAIVILLTMNTLKMDADTLERLPMCGIEAHVHSIEEGCFALADDGVSYVLICDRPEHVHEDACFQQRPDYSSQELEAAVEAQPVEAADGEIQAEDEGLFVDVASIRDYALGSDSGDEPEGDAAETLATEGGESVYRYAMKGRRTARLSDVLRTAGMPVDMGEIVELGPIENTDAQAGLIGVSNVGGDYEITALRDFDRAELGIITDDDILIVTLTGGVEAQPEAVAVEAPADEPVEEPADEPVKEPADGALEVLVDEPVKESADGALELLVDGIVEETADGSVEEAPADRIEAEPADDGAETEPTEDEADAEPTDELEGEAEVIDDYIIEADGRMRVELSNRVYVEAASEGLALPDEATGSASMLSADAADAAWAEVQAMLAAASAPKKMLKLAARSAAPATTEVGYRAFDISLENVDAGEYADGFRVNVLLPEAVTGRAFELYHIHTDEEGGREISRIPDDQLWLDSVEAASGAETVRAFSFVTDSFSTFLLKYTVDVEVEGAVTTVRIDFTDFEADDEGFEDSAIRLMDEGVQIDLGALLKGGAGRYQTIDVEFDTVSEIGFVNENYAMARVEGGVDYADGWLRVTGNGVIELTDGVNTVIVNVTGYAEIVEEIRTLIGDGVTIRVHEGDVPENAVPVASEVDDAAALAEQYNVEIDPANSGAAAFDVKIEDDGELWTGEGLYEVEMPADLDVEALVPAGAELVGVEYTVYHIHDGEATEIEGGVEDGVLRFTTDSFSEFLVKYTVDFHYIAAGGTFDYTLTGGGALSLRALLEALRVLDAAPEVDEAVESEAEAPDYDSFMSNIANVAFSDETLLKPLPVEEDTTAGELRLRWGLEPEYSAEVTEAEIAEMDAQAFTAPDWALMSLKPFDTEETLTVVLTDGETFTIRVTDAQIRKMFLSAEGETYEIVVTYDDAANIPEGSELEVTEILPRTEAYEYYLTRSAWKLETENTAVSFARFFDIEIVHDGQKVEPDAPVEVQIAYKRAMEIGEDESLSVVHFADSGVEVIGNTFLDAQNTTIIYDQGSFSVTGTIISGTPSSADSADYDLLPKHMIIVQDGDRYYIVNNDASLTEVGYDSSANPPTVVVADPMLWAFENSGDNTHIFFNSEATGFGTSLIASDYYRRYLDPNQDGAWVQEQNRDNTAPGYVTVEPKYENYYGQYISQFTGEDGSTIYITQIPHPGGRVDVLNETSLVLNNGTISSKNGGKYLAIERDAAGTPIRLVGGAEAADAAHFIYADASRVPSGLHLDNAVNHIDISITGVAQVKVPLAYGKYYDEDGNVILTVDDNMKVTLTDDQVYKENENDDPLEITPEDMKRATITARDKDGRDLDDAFYITGFSQNALTEFSTSQVRIDGRFLVSDLRGTQYEHIDGSRYDGGWRNGWFTWPDQNYVNAVRQARKNNIVDYTVTVVKPVTYYLVNPENPSQYLYNADGEMMKVTVDVAFSGSFNYWDYGKNAKNSGNECPPVQNNADWRAGDIPNHDMSGMDFVLTGDVENPNSPLVAIEITKIIMDEDGNRIDVRIPVTSYFDIYENRTANRNSGVAGLNVDSYVSEPDPSLYEGYSKLRTGKITIGEGENGSDLLYDYNVTDAMYYIVEHSDGDLAKTVVDTANNEWQYVRTYIETEYVRRGDVYDDKDLYPDPMHHTRDYTEADGTGGFRSIPEVVGKFNDLNGEQRKSGFLEFYVYNVYTRGLELPVEKTWAEGSEPPDGAEVTMELRYAQRKVKNADGSDVTPVPDWSAYQKVVPGQNGFDSGLTVNLTLKADEDESKNWKDSFKDLPRTRKDESGTYELDYTVAEISVRVPGDGGGMKDVTADYSIETAMTDDGVLVITNRKEITRLDVEKIWAEGTPIPTGAKVEVTLKYATRIIRNADGTEPDPETEFPDYDAYQPVDGDDLFVDRGIVAKIELQADAEHEENNWKGAFENLPKFVKDADGNLCAVDYYAVETAVPVPGSGDEPDDRLADYHHEETKAAAEREDAENSNGKVTIENREIVVVEVQKTWEPAPSDDAWARVQLKRYMAPTPAPTATPEPTPTPTPEPTATPEPTSQRVVKVWDDDNNRDGKRPASIEVELLANGEVVETVTLQQSNQWSATVDSLPTVDESGNGITYSWQEPSVTGYTLDMSVSENTTTLTNTHEIEKTDAKIVVVWNDSNNAEGQRPESLTMSLSDGQQVTLNDANSWQATISDLPKNARGSEIGYEWSQPDVDGYDMEATVDESTRTTTLTYTLKPKKEFVTITIRALLHPDTQADSIKWESYITNNKVTINGAERTLPDTHRNDDFNEPIVIENVPINSAVSISYVVDKHNGQGDAQGNTPLLNSITSQASHKILPGYWANERIVNLHIGTDDVEVVAVISEAARPTPQPTRPSLVYVTVRVGTGQTVNNQTPAVDGYEEKAIPYGSKLILTTKNKDQYGWRRASYWDSADATKGWNNGDKELTDTTNRRQEGDYYVSTYVIDSVETDIDLFAISGQGLDHICSVEVIPPAGANGLNSTNALTPRSVMAAPMQLMPPTEKAYSVLPTATPSPEDYGFNTPTSAPVASAVRSVRTASAPRKAAMNNGHFVQDGVTKPDGYVEDAEFNDDTDPVILTLNGTDGWKQSFPEQDRYDPQGREYVYYVEEIDFAPSDYHTESIVEKDGTVVIRNVKETEATGTLDFQAKKIFTNGDLGAHTFTFKLTQVTGDQFTTQANASNVDVSVMLGTAETRTTTADSGTVDTVDFTRITFTKNDTVDDTGEYWFLLEEVVPDDVDANGVKGGVKYDRTKKWIKVTVADAGGGVLSVTKDPDPTSGEPDGTWTNEQLGQLQITKNLQTDGILDPDRTGEFGYAVYGAPYDPDAQTPQEPVATGTIQVTQSGTQTVTVSDLPFGDYYVYELDGDGNPIVSGDGGAIKVIGEQPYRVTGSGVMVTVPAEAEAESGDDGENTQAAGPEPGEVTLNNSVETVKAQVVKVWNDDGNSANKRPTGLSVTLYAHAVGDDTGTGTQQGDPVVLNSGNGWSSDVIDNLPAYDSQGRAIAYNWVEGNMPAGYFLTSSTTSTGTNGEIITTLTNTLHTYDLKTSYTGVKTWEDNNNGWKTRPDPKDFVVTLYEIKKSGDGYPETGTALSLKPTWPYDKGSSQWTYIFDNLPVFDDNGEVIKYYAVETVPGGYEQKEGTGQPTATTWTLGTAYTVDKVTPNSTVSWDLGSLIDLSFLIIKDTDQDFVIWTHRVPTPNELSQINQCAEDAFGDFKNNNKTKIYISGIGHVDTTKGYVDVVYDDSSANPKVTLTFSAECVWATYAKGQFSGTQYDIGTTNFTNTLQETELSGSKTWRISDDYGPVDNAENVTLQLTRSTTTTTQSEETGEDDQPAAQTTTETVHAVDADHRTTYSDTGTQLLQPVWTGDDYKYDHLPRTDRDGNEYTYAVAEWAFKVGEYTYTVDAATGAVTKSDAAAPDIRVTRAGNDFTNTEVTTVAVTKAWENRDVSDAAPPQAQVVFDLYRNGTKVEGKSITLDGAALTAEEAGETTFGEFAAWTATWNDLDAVDEQGEPYAYTVQEAEGGWEHYVVSYPDDTVTQQAGQSASDGETITNTEQTIGIHVTKKWKERGQDKVFDEETSVGFTLHQIYTCEDGEGQPQTVDAVYTDYGDNGKGTVTYHPAVTEPEPADAYWDTVDITGLPKKVYDAERESWYDVTYYVVEDPIEDVDTAYSTDGGATTSATALENAVGEDGTVTIVNTDSTTEITVKKTWSGNTGEITAYTINYKVQASEDGENWTDYDADDDGMPEAYTMTYSAPEEPGTEATITGNVVGDLPAGRSYRAVETGYAVTIGGETVEMTGIAVKGTAADDSAPTTIANTLTDKEATKIWVNTDPAKLAEAQVTFRLYREIDGVRDPGFAPAPVTLTINDKLNAETLATWKTTWNNLPTVGAFTYTIPADEETGTEAQTATRSGEFTYGVEETLIKYNGDEYPVAGNVDAANKWVITQEGDTITNTLNETDVEVTKVWKDNNDGTGEVVAWPTSVSGITLNLIRGTNETENATTFTAEDTDFGVAITVDADGTAAFAALDGRQAPSEDERNALTCTVTPVHDPDTRTVAYRIKVGGLEARNAQGQTWIYRFAEASLPGYTVTYQNASGEDKGTSAKNAYDGEQITNSLIRVSLPSTGGPGTTLIYASGAGLLALAILWFVRRQKRRWDNL